jgi:hypothetical protein
VRYGAETSRSRTVVVRLRPTNAQKTALFITVVHGSPAGDQYIATAGTSGICSWRLPSLCTRRKNGDIVAFSSAASSDKPLGRSAVRQVPHATPTPKVVGVGNVKNDIVCRDSPAIQAKGVTQLMGIVWARQKPLV